jgi:hypothetical protein
MLRDNITKGAFAPLTGEIEIELYRDTRRYKQWLDW